MEASMPMLDETLEKLTADPELGAMIPFPALGLAVCMKSTGEPDMFAVKIYDAEPTLLVDEVHDIKNLRRLMLKTAGAEDRRIELMGRVLALRADQYLRSL